jgi:sentrin-specific protease 1
MQGSGLMRLDRILKYLELEFADKEYPFDISEWTFVHKTNIPKQTNGYDCGVFVCAFAESIALHNSDFSFTQKDFTIGRLKMALAIKYKGLRLSNVVELFIIIV